MKTLVTYYSYTGNTKKVAEKIAKNIKAEVKIGSTDEEKSGDVVVILGK